MTDEQRQRIWEIENSCDGRTELAERIVGLEDENKKLIVKLNAEYIVRQNVEIENARLREYAAKAWSLFIRHGAVHPCDLSEVDAVRDGLRELGVEVD